MTGNMFRSVNHTVVIGFFKSNIYCLILQHDERLRAIGML